MASERKGLIEQFFDFYSVYFGVTAPPPAKQKLMLAALVFFFVGLALVLFVVAELVSKL
ncbi:MAG TPA: hypothetical protein VN577_00635 [Terriglobales bacterium]|nr:hypothetical protein [Terriglobales bacterium]